MAKAKAPPAGTELPLGDESEHTSIDGKVRDSIFAALGWPPGLYDVAVRNSGATTIASTC